MFVMSQDRNVVVETTGKYFWVEENDWGGTKSSFDIVVDSNDHKNFTLATYLTQSQAEAELFRMFKSFEDEKCRTYMFVADRKVVKDGACG